MNAEESLSTPDRGEQRFFPSRAHGRGVIGACLSQIPSREEQESLVLSQITIEYGAILRGDDVETVCPPKLCEYGFRERLPLASSLYDAMLEPGGFAEKQNPRQLILVVAVRCAPTGRNGRYESHRAQQLENPSTCSTHLHALEAVRVHRPGPLSPSLAIQSFFGLFGNRWNIDLTMARGSAVRTVRFKQAIAINASGEHEPSVPLNVRGASSPGALSRPARTTPRA
jgi:hypothetical protein